MADKNNRKAEEFKKATAATYRALAQINVSDIAFSSTSREDLHSFQDSLKPRLPSPDSSVSKKSRNAIRGAADTKALQLRYHDQATHLKNRPQDGGAQSLFNALEQARCEALGINSMRGVADNLKAALKDKCSRYDYGNVTDRDETNLPDVLHLMARKHFTGEKIPRSGQNIINLWQKWLDSRQIDTIFERLYENLDSQESFAREARELIERLDIDQEEGEDEQSETSPDDDEDTSTEDDNEQGDEGETQPEDTPPPPPSDDHMPGDTEQSPAEEDTDIEDAETGEDTMPQPRQPPREGHNAMEPPLRKYEIYTTKFDEIVSADKLSTDGELRRLRGLLDKQLTHLQGMTTRLANRLQRKLLARQRRSWQFDMEEGILDVSRLARIVANPTTPLSFKQEREDEFKDTVVSLLIDNSGSMRGRPITIAAMTTDVIARTLERAGVKTEILGFTTRAWKGGKSRDLWVQNGRPPHPGRLNDIRHIVYKGADAAWRRSRKNLGLMLKEGLLKENIDGEALLWAHSRLVTRPEQRKILIVISDGAPVDDSTLSVNPSNVLETDLHNVIEWIESRSPIELSAIGIGHDVTRYYNRAITIADADQLGKALTEQLEDLFDAA